MWQNKVVKNAGWIIGCKIIKAVLTLVVTSLTARYLGAANYGLLNYAIGVVSFVIPIAKLGLDSTIVHEIINRPEEEGKVLGTVIVLNIISALCCIAGVIAFVSIVNVNEADAIIVCAIYSVLLLFQAIEMLHYWFQAKLMSKYSAIAMLVSYIFVTGFQIILIVLKCNVYLFALSYSVDFFIIDFILLIIYKKKSNQKLAFSKSLVKSLLSKSKFYILSNLMGTIYYQADKVMLKLMINNEVTGIYSAAITCASMASFIFGAIIDSMRPEIFTAKTESLEKAEQRISDLYTVIIYASLLFCAAITGFAPLIIKIMYGDSYSAAVTVLRVVVWFTTFSYLGTVRDIWLLLEGKQKYLLLINLLGAILNIVLNYFFIQYWGAIGAALTSLFTQIFNNFLLGFFIKPLRRNNILLLRGLNIKNFIVRLKDKS